MRYMMLIHHDEPALAAADQKQLWQDYAAFNEALSKAAGASSGERLEPSNKGTTVRTQGEKTDVLDGPYADTKEQLGGYFVIDVPDLDAALDWAARAPCAQTASVEVRPVLPPMK